MNSGQDFTRLYSEVSDSISHAMETIAGLNVEHSDGKQELHNMSERLRRIQACFNDELNFLQENSEWEKFTIAFFGETNAGKSTIIESLRILFKEDSRQQLLHQNAQDLAKFEQALSGHVNQVCERLNAVYMEHAENVMAMKQSAIALSKILAEETSGRIKRKLRFAAVGGVTLGAAAVGAITLLAGG